MTTQAAEKHPDLLAGQRLALGLDRDEGIHWHETRLEANAREDGRLTVVWPKEQLEDGSAGTLVPIRQGGTVVVEASSADDALYALEMRVEHAYELQDNSALTLVPVGTWTRQQRRMNVRCRTNITPSLAEVKSEEGGWDSFTGTIREISATGLLIRTDEALPLNRRLDMGFPLPPKGEGVRVRAEVRRVHHVDPDLGKPFWEAGCELVDMKVQDQDRIRHFIFEEMRAQRQRQMGLTK